MDRSNLALLAPLVSKDLGLSSVQMGLLFSAFGWAYVAGQLPGGWIVDTFPPRVLYPIMMGAWSLVTCAQAIAGSFASLCGLRLGMGLLEAPSFPTNAKVVTAWFPEQERARAIGFYVSGQFVGLAFVAPVLAYTQTLVGWRGAFLATGAIGLIFSVVWYLVYRDPADCPSANAAELEHIRQGGGTVGAPAKKSGPTWTWAQLRVVLGTRSLWGVFLGHTCVTATLWFFLTWFPSYLVDYRKMGFIKMGIWTSVPFIAAFVGVILSGTLSDFLVRRGASLATARKTPVVSGLILSMSIVGANYVEREGLVMLFMTVAFFGNGLASIGWSFVSALAPANLIGTTGALYNFIGNSSAIFVPIVIGWLVRGGSFEPALIFIGACALVGAFAYGVMVRDVKRIEVGS
jgi:ACS family D-galactonate transporter-like MFS transporter